MLRSTAWAGMAAPLLLFRADLRPRSRAAEQGSATIVAMVTHRYAAIVDTNVFVDLYTTVDLERTYAAPDWHGVDDRESAYRRSRARDALIFALYLHEIGASTWSLRTEPSAILERVAPPKMGSIKTATTTNFLRVFLHFVKTTLLSRWDDRTPIAADGLRGNNADLALLWMASENATTLVTNEGNATIAAKPDSLRAKGALVNVRVVTPREFVPLSFDADRAIARFFQRYRDEAPAYFARSSRTRKFMLHMLGFYRHVLLGVTEGRALPVAVALPSSWAPRLGFVERTTRKMHRSALGLVLAAMRAAAP